MSLVETDLDEGVVTITLNRPEARNALSVGLCDAIADALAEIDPDPQARVLVVRGAGKVFCSGADFGAVSGPGGLEFLPAFERMLEAVARHRLPAIASIQGAALGGGLQLATVCDFRVAAEDAQLGIPSSRLGILVNFENVERLVALAGIVRAKEILMAGRTFTGAEALAAGLVTRSVAAEALDTATYGLAGEVAALSPLSVQGAKRALLAVSDHLAGARRTAPDDVADIDRLVAEAYGSEDLAEGLAAAAEKRSPRFKGN